MRQTYTQTGQSAQLNEKFDHILAGKTLQERAERAQEIASKDVTFAPLMAMASIKSEKIVGLPEGVPDTYTPETDVPDGVADTTARQEFRRIRNFLPYGTMKNLKAHDREQSWLNLLMGLHHKEAKILTMIKEQTLFVEYPELRNVLIELKVPVDVEAPVAEKSTKKAKAVKEKKAPKPK